MGLVEVNVSVNRILSQLEKEKRILQKLDESIKKTTNNNPNRYQNDRNADRSFQSNQNDGPRGGGRNLNRNFYPEGGHNRSFDEDNRQARKRPQETKTVFSRLSGRVPVDSDGEDDPPFMKKPRVSSQVIRELPTKQEVLKAQAGDEVSKARNRRMFGSLLGTLQKFKQEEIILKNKEEKKAQIEKKIEDQAKLEKENQKRERQTLFAEREMKKASIKALEAKMIRLESYEVWEKTQKPLLNFIQTKWKPHINWLPKKMNHQVQEKFDFSRKKQEKLIEDKQRELKEELEAIEQKCLRNMKLPPGMKKRPTSLSDTLEHDEDINQSMDHDAEDDGDDEEDAHVSVHGDDDDAEEGEIRPKIKQEKDEKIESTAYKVTNFKVEKDVKIVNKVINRDRDNRDRDSDSDSTSSSSDDEQKKTQDDSSDDDDNSQDEEDVHPKTVKTEVNGDYKTEDKKKVEAVSSDEKPVASQENPEN